MMQRSSVAAVVSVICLHVSAVILRFIDLLHVAATLLQTLCHRFA